MIPIILYDLRWRVLALAFVAWVLFLLEPGFHQHGASEIGQVPELGPVGVSATLSYLTSVSMIVLLAGFIAAERREGFGRILFSHPTTPIAYHGLRLLVALTIVIAVAAAFLVVGQIVAWGGFYGGWSGLILATISAIVYGGVMTFLSALLDRGAAATAFIIFLPTFAPQIFTLGFAALPAPLRVPLLMLLPPQGAFEDIWNGLIDGRLAWGAMAFALGYAAVWLLAGALIVRWRDVP